MNVTISGRKTTVKDSFREKAQRKLSKLDRFFGDQAQALLTVTNEGDRETVEVTIQSGGMFYRAEKTTSDRFDSLDAVADSLFKQIVKNKGKLESRLRPEAFTFSPEEPDLPNEESEKYQIVKVKRFPMKPMDVEEAILQMNLLGHTFFMFLNQETEDICLVYRRKNGDYGMIEPSNGEEEED